MIRVLNSSKFKICLEETLSKANDFILDANILGSPEFLKNINKLLNEINEKLINFTFDKVDQLNNEANYIKLH